MNFKKDVQFYFDQIQRTASEKNVDRLKSFFVLPAFFVKGETADIAKNEKEISEIIKVHFSTFLRDRCGRTYYDVESANSLTDQEIVTSIRWSFFDKQDQLFSDQTIHYHLRQIYTDGSLQWKIYLTFCLADKLR